MQINETGFVFWMVFNSVNICNYQLENDYQGCESKYRGLWSLAGLFVVIGVTAVVVFCIKFNEKIVIISFEDFKRTVDAAAADGEEYTFDYFLRSVDEKIANALISDKKTHLLIKLPNA